MLAKSNALMRDRGNHERLTLRRNAWRVAAAGVSAVALVSLAACSSSSKSASSTGSAAGANVTAAQSAIAPYLVAPTVFPAGDPLPSKLPAGKNFVFLQCATPICAVTEKLTAAAVGAIGGKMTAINVGITAQTAQAGASSALALKPDAVILGAIDPSLFGTGLKALSDAGVKLVSLQIDKDVTPYGITFNYLGTDLSQKNGKLMADWVIANKGAQTNTVLYTLPALDLSAPLQAAFQAEMKSNCAACKVRVVPLDAASIGTTAPRTIVTDLQAHTGTNAAVFVSLSAAAGLPAALSAAGLSVSTIGFGPAAANLQDIKDGKITAALATSFPVSTWTSVDIAARLIEGAQPTASEKAGEVPEQILEQKDITFDPSTGWLGFNDFAQRFATIWHTTS
ncbi:MAG: substrate-binding domain-containing protein [Actinomycetota bacterium]|nr:substrate-binding domain-containing protein [Actinomycetota bacterium]